MKYWWDKSGLRFECVMCGKCCGGEPGSVWVSEQETSLIGGFLNINSTFPAPKHALNLEKSI